MLQVPLKRFRERGNSQILFLGLLALVAALAMEFRNRSTERKNQAHLNALRAESEMVLDSLEARLKNADTCSDTLSGETLEPGKILPVTLHFEFDKNLLAGGTAVTEGGLKLAALDLEVPEHEDMRTTIVDASGVATEVWRFPVRLHAQFVTQKNENLPVARNFPEGIPAFVWSLPPPPLGSGQIVSCFGRNSAAFLCNETGGYFQPHAKPYDQSCRPSLKTLRRSDARLVPSPNCRLGGIAQKPSDCAKFGVKFGADEVNGPSKILDGAGPRYLCQVCQ